MSDYIEREAAEAVFRNARKSLIAKRCDYSASEYLTRETMLLNAEQIIHVLPAADVREVVTCGKRVLDPCCGSRMFWFDKENPDVEFCDKRELHTTLCDGRSLDIKPDTFADFTDLPFADNTFWHVVFDPPHILNIGENSWMAKKYGKLPPNWEDVICQGFSECMRVLKPNGTLIFKWNEQDIPVSKIISVIGYTPLYGHKSGKLQKTHWMAFIKDDDFCPNCGADCRGGNDGE